MDPQWDDSQPIYRQLRDRVVAMILEGVLKKATRFPSSALLRRNSSHPLTFSRLQQLVDEGWSKKPRPGCLSQGAEHPPENSA